MNINLALILTLLTAFTGAVIALDKFYFSRRRENGLPQSLEIAIEYSRSFFPVLLFVLLIRSFVFEPFRIPSGSMMPTLLQGDFIFVKKYSYGLRLPVIEKKIIETGQPKHGDVVVFRLPSDPNVNYIKRVIGLPGDVIEYSNHRLTVNGVPVPHQLKESVSASRVLTETLGGREHEIMITDPQRKIMEGIYRVEEGHFFMMGDNRDNSRDSRYIGSIPETHLVGEAVRIWMHMDGLEWPDWGRIGTKIQ
ncbi:MAG: signal peptidase I [Gammaproteobacteria bacterium]|nr:signal peptidase I [Gammaproteobacteria bacterium]MDH4313526.1 signal peptidase I [Gammaproteobacteria bacterium]MDH5212595.1 signal peptidase I [Gammaproteobacteria bacterium]MDH5500539.1 signal peptidase I [Gammaproteobacteria bacterium]